MRKLLPVIACVLAVLVAGLLLVGGRAGSGSAGPVAVASATGQVVDALTGAPVEAHLEAPGDAVESESDGSFRLGLEGPSLVRVSAAGYLPRTLALAAGADQAIGLTPEADGSLSLRFGGDVMLGRRYFEAYGDDEPWLSPEPTAEELAAPLAQVAPLLGDADLTVVNLETALVAEPYVNGPRPAGVHPEKDLVITSPLGLAGALADAGVDVVDLANNHLYDALDAGVASTLAAVDEAGLVRFGAGASLEEAWRPAYVEAAGQTVGFVGCTTVDGEAHRVGYVATAEHGGAARCEEGRLVAALSEARARADMVVFMLHGGTEYVREQTPEVRHFSSVAARGGATLVVDGHPHVVGGVSEVDGVPVVESMGNLLFDQVLWETFAGYLARVDLAGGKPARTVFDPIALDGYRPVPVVAGPADAAARIAAGTLAGTVQLAPGGAATPGVGEPSTEALELAGGEVATLPPGAWLADGDPGYRPGTDLLLGTGSAEDLDTDPGSGPAMLWALGKYAAVSREAACAGELGYRLRRSPVSTKDVVAAPAHRQAVVPGDRLSLVLDLRQASAGASMEIRWYAGAAGASVETVRLPLPVHSGHDACRQVRLDVQVPPGVRAVQPWLRLRPPHDVNLASDLQVDDVRLVSWGGVGSAGRRHDIIESLEGATVVTLRRDAVYR